MNFKLVRLQEFGKRVFTCSRKEKSRLRFTSTNKFPHRIMAISNMPQTDFSLPFLALSERIYRNYIYDSLEYLTEFQTVKRIIEHFHITYAREHQAYGQPSYVPSSLRRTLPSFLE